MGLTLRNPYVASPRSQEFDEGSFARLEDLLVEVVVVELDGRRSERKRREEQARRHIIFACVCVSCRSPRNTRHAYMHVYNALQVLVLQVSHM